MQKELVKKQKNRKEKPMDFWFLFITIVLLCIGLIMLSSASSYYGLMQFKNSNHFLVRQIITAIIGVIAMFIVSKIDYKYYMKLAPIGYVLSLILMLIVFIPGIGGDRKGANRWIDLGFTTIQPSEIMKVVLIIAISTYIIKNFNKSKGYIIPIIMLGAVVIVMFIQSHLSGTVIMGFVFGVAFLLSGVKIKPIYIIAVILIIAGVFSAFILKEGFRSNRIKAFLNPNSDLKGDNWQVSQSLYALGSGGIIGKGLGQSRQKYLWLPEAQNDFIFSIVGEEFGIIGSLTVISLFSIFIFRGIMIGIKSNDLYAMMLACRNNINVCISNNYKYSGGNINYACNWYAFTIF